MIKFWNSLNYTKKISFILLFFSFFLIGFFEVITIASIPIIITYVISPEAFFAYFPDSSIKVYLQNTFGNLPIINKFIYSAIFVSIFFLFKNIIVYSIYVFESGFTKRLGTELQNKIYLFYMKKSYLDFISFSPGEIIRDIQFSHNTMTYIRGWMICIKEVVIILGLIITILINNQLIGLVLIIFFPIGGILQIYFSKIVKKWGYSTAKVRKTLLNTIRESIDLILETKIYKKDIFFLKKFLSQIIILETNTYKSKLVANLYKPLFETIFVVFVFSSIIFLLAQNYSINQTLPIISLLVFSLIRILPSINGFLMSFNNIKFNSKAKEIVIKKYVDLSTQEIKDNKKIINLDFKKKIQVKNLNFNFKDTKKSCLKNINLQINKNDKIAILGKVGSGKTSLINVLTGLYKFNKGSIIIDDETYIKPGSNFLWNKAAYFKQSASIINDTIKKNIIFSSNKFNRKKFNQIVSLVGVNKNLINSQIDLNRDTGISGSKMSGGQKQIISFARTFYSDAEIIFLDEPTNNLDLKLKKKVINYLKSIKKTLIIITHDPNVIIACNKIILMKKGNLKFVQNKKTFLKKYKNIMNLFY